MTISDPHRDTRYSLVNICGTDAMATEMIRQRLTAGCPAVFRSRWV